MPNEPPSPVKLSPQKETSAPATHKSVAKVDTPVRNLDNSPTPQKKFPKDDLTSVTPTPELIEPTGPKLVKQNSLPTEKASPKLAKQNSLPTEKASAKGTCSSDC
jgi:hypothetical protein